MSKLNSYVNYEQIIGHSIKIGKKIRLESIFNGAMNRTNKNFVKLGGEKIEIYSGII